jgi:hypothetical protein
VKRTVFVLGVLAVTACSDVPSTNPLGPSASRIEATIVTGDLVVTSSSDAGPGSFRDAIAQANANPSIATIAFLPNVNTIGLQSGIVFSGTQHLTINANQATVDASGAGAGVSAFVAATSC